MVLLVAPTVTCAARLLDTDAVTPVPQLLSLLPWLGAPAAAALLLAPAARGRARPALAAWAAGVVAAAVWSALPYGPATTAARGPAAAAVRVLTANVEYGDAVPALVDAARRERPDLLFVQECDPVCADALSAALADRLPHRAGAAREGAAGSAVFSAFPLTGPDVLPGTALGMPGATTRVGGVAVRLRLAHPVPPVPGLVGEWRRELGLLRDEAAARRGTPAVVAGDFNAAQDHAAFRAVLRAGGLHDAARLAGRARTPSWPADLPVPPWTQIDHVLVSGDFAVRGARFLDLPGSDHRALVVDAVLHRDG
ncbi:endonuclease/exonuclease/phosphatase family protein [Streptomyces kanasensis]|uniref:endonuclease/exonuclease/phosphatase family protein n=1 Tax=Streptomyces kanasensis TaxID=936756 RepID=UPI0036F780AE